MVHKQAGIGEVLPPDSTVVADSCFLGRRIKTSKVGQKLFICYVKYLVFLGFDSLPVLQDLEDRKKRTSESRAQKKKDLDSDAVSEMNVCRN